MNGGYVMLSMGGLDIMGGHGNVTVNGSYAAALNAIKNGKPIILCNGTIYDISNNVQDVSPIQAFGHRDGADGIIFYLPVSNIHVTVNDVWFVSEL